MNKMRDIPGSWDKSSKLFRNESKWQKTILYEVLKDYWPDDQHQPVRIRQQLNRLTQRDQFRNPTDEVKQHEINRPIEEGIIMIPEMRMMNKVKNQVSNIYIFSVIFRKKSFKKSQ